MSVAVPSPADLLRPQLDLLIWDAPNIDMTLSNVIGRRATSATRPRYDHVARWFIAGAGERNVEAAVFTNYTEGTGASIRPWLEAVRLIGFAVFIKPKFEAVDDIDEQMLAHVKAAGRKHRLVRLVVVSGDGRNFQEFLEALASEGIDVTVVSFSEVASWAAQSPLIKFTDLEDIPGAFRGPLDRTRLENLPRGGAWLPPSGDLRANAAKDVADDPPEDELPVAS